MAPIGRGSKDAGHGGLVAIQVGLRYHAGAASMDLDGEMLEVSSRNSSTLTSKHVGFQWVNLLHLKKHLGDLEICQLKKLFNEEIHPTEQIFTNKQRQLYI